MSCCQAGQGYISKADEPNKSYLAIDLKKDIAFLTPKKAQTTTKAIGSIIET